MNKKLVKVLALYLFSSTCFACTSNIENILDGGTPMISSSSALITDVKATTYFLGWNNVGDTTIKVKPDKDILPALTAKKTDLKNISANELSNLEGGFRMLSIGGSLSAGFRDGGLYREAQLTAFPNLVARQMGVTFNQPLFDATDGNGSGYKMIAGTEPIVSFKMVTNNLSYADNTKADKFKKFAGSQNDQFAIPDITKKFDLTGFDQKFIDRLVNDNTKAKYKTPLEWVMNEKADFAIFELGTDDLVKIILRGGAGSLSSSFFGFDFYSKEFWIMKNLSDNKAKGVILNVPAILDFPYFKQFTEEKIKKLSVQLLVQKSSGSDYYRSFDFANDILLPTATVEKLFRGQGISNMSDADVLSKDTSGDEISDASPVLYNKFEIEARAKDYNWPVVDMYGFYKRVFAKNFVTDDGVTVNPAWPKGGNFFSEDGLYPNAFGQAVIANEVIKTINQHYKLAIPLVETRFFLKK
jgi:hypothetical protein